MNSSVFLSWILAFAVSVGLGYFVISALWPKGLSRGLIWVFAPGVGLGLCSLIFFLFRRPMFTVEVSLLLVCVLWAWFRRRPNSEKSSLLTWRVPFYSLFLACGIGLVISGLMFTVERAPHGDWDALSIWNSHARYLYRDGPSWKTGIRNTFHPDYPLLTPASTARLWRYAGEETPDAGGVLGILFTLSGVTVLAVVLAELRDPVVATLGSLLLLSTPSYLEQGVYQYADVPLSLYVLSTVALLCLHFRRAPNQVGLVALAGLTAGLAGWTKNEGLLFIGVTSTLLLFPVVARPQETLRRFAAFVAGLLLPLAVILIFKLTIAPPADLLQNRSYAELAEKLLSFDRYAIIFGLYSQTFWSFGNWMLHPVIPLLAFIGLRGMDRDMLRNHGWITGFGVLILLSVGYSAVYLLTPMDLRWHLESSLSRLFLQLWPTFLLVACLAARELAAPKSGLPELH